VEETHWGSWLGHRYGDWAFFKRSIHALSPLTTDYTTQARDVYLINRMLEVNAAYKANGTSETQLAYTERRLSTNIINTIALNDVLKFEKCVYAWLGSVTKRGQLVLPTDVLRSIRELAGSMNDEARTHSHAHAHAHAHLRKHTRTHTDTHTHAHAHAHKHKHLHIHIHMFAHPHTHTHTHTNTHVRTLGRQPDDLPRWVTTGICRLHRHKRSHTMRTHTHVRTHRHEHLRLKIEDRHRHWTL
jgi:hypothetical protein